MKSRVSSPVVCSAAPTAQLPAPAQHVLQLAATLQPLLRTPASAAAAADVAAARPTLAALAAVAARPVVDSGDDAPGPQRTQADLRARLVLLAVHAWRQRAPLPGRLRLPRVPGPAAPQLADEARMLLKSMARQAITEALTLVDAAPQLGMARQASVLGARQALVDVYQLASALAPLTPVPAQRHACNAVAKQASRTLASLHAASPGLLFHHPLAQDTDYVPQQGDALVAALPRVKGRHLPPLEVATLVEKVRQPLAPTLGAALSPAAAAARRPDGVMAYKVVQLGSGERFTLHPRLSDREGAHGKIHLTQRDGDEAVYVTKVQRSQDKLSGSQRFFVADVAAMVRKAELSAGATARIDAHAARAAAVFAPQTGALRHLGAELASAALTHHFVDEFGKYHQVMRAMDGDLQDLGSAMGSALPRSPALVRQLRLSAAAQLFFQLEGLHAPRLLRDRGIAHQDIKRNNILFNRDGAVRLIDFDEAAVTGRFLRPRRPVDDKRASLLAPELFLAELRDDRPLGKKTDVWATAITLLDLGHAADYEAQPAANADPDRPPLKHRASQESLQPHDNLRINWALGDPVNKKLMPNPRAAFAAYTAWHEAVVDRNPAWDGRLAPLTAEAEAAIVAAALPLAGKAADADRHATYALRKFHRFFTTAGEQDGPLTALFLQQALLPRPRDRATAAALSRTLQGRMQHLSDADRAQLTDFTQDVVRNMHT